MAKSRNRNQKRNQRVSRRRVQSRRNSLRNQQSRSLSKRKIKIRTSRKTRRIRRRNKVGGMNGENTESLIGCEDDESQYLSTDPEVSVSNLDKLKASAIILHTEIKEDKLKNLGRVCTGKFTNHTPLYEYENKKKIEEILKHIIDGTGTPEFTAKSIRRRLIGLIGLKGFIYNIPIPNSGDILEYKYIDGKVLNPVIKT